MPEITRAFPKPTAQVQPYFEVLGPDLTVDFLFTFGGAEIFVSDSPKARSRHEKLIENEMTKALGERLNPGPSRVPLAERRLAQVLSFQGHSSATIARQLRVSDTTVCKWLKAAG